MNDIPLNQTDFGETQPLFEGPSLPSTPQTPTLSPEEDEIVSKPTQQKNTLLIVAGIISLLLIVTLFVLLSLSKRNRVPVFIPPVSPTPVAQTAQQSQLQLSITQLDTDIKLSDPQNNSLPFPPINFSLHLKAPSASTSP